MPPICPRNLYTGRIIYSGNVSLFHCDIMILCELCNNFQLLAREYPFGIINHKQHQQKKVFLAQLLYEFMKLNLFPCIPSYRPSAVYEI